MRKIVNIFVGWWFWVTNRNDKLAQVRLSVCATCKHRKAFMCGVCGCVLQAKARLFDEDCPLKQWPAHPWVVVMGKRPEQ